MSCCSLSVVYIPHCSCSSDCHAAAAAAWFLQVSLRTSEPLHTSVYSTSEVRSVSSQPAHTNEIHMGSLSFHITAYSLSTSSYWKSFFLDATASFELQEGHWEQLLSVSDTVGTKGHPIQLPHGKFKIKYSTSSMHYSSVWLVTPGGQKGESLKNYYLHLLVENW